MERAKLGRQHSFSTVRCTRSMQPLLGGRPAWMKRSWAPVLAKAWRNPWERNSLPLSSWDDPLDVDTCSVAPTSGSPPVAEWERIEPTPRTYSRDFPPTEVDVG